MARPEPSVFQNVVRPHFEIASIRQWRYWSNFVHGGYLSDFSYYTT